MTPTETEDKEVQTGTEETVEKTEKEEGSEQEQESDTEETEEGAKDNEESSEKTDEEATEEEESAETEKPSKRSASETIRTLKAERNAERAEREKLITERATALAQLEFVRQQQQQFQSNEQRVAEEKRLSLLDPQERAIYQANQKAAALEFRLNQMEVSQADYRDKAEFQAKAAYDETYSKYADQVEHMYQEGLARGVRASREDLLAYQVGKELLKDKNSKANDKKKAAGKRIDSVTSKPANARGDVAGTKKGKSEEDRLRGVLI